MTQSVSTGCGSRILQIGSIESDFCTPSPRVHEKSHPIINRACWCSSIPTGVPDCKRQSHSLDREDVTLGLQPQVFSWEK
jgi:hypothetical protein